VDITHSFTPGTTALVTMTPILKPAFTHVMKYCLALALLAWFSPAPAADKQNPASDPFAGALFPAEMVLMARDRISLTQEQLDAIRARAEKVQPRANELRAKLESEAAALAALVKQERVDESALHQQLDKVLDLEREVKHLYLGLAVTVKNLLTPDQQAKLHEIAATDMKQLSEDTKKRLSEKVERVKADAQKWAASGRDPSEILKSMEEKFKPMMDQGKIIEAEALLDQILNQFTQDSK
jgi:Spy/CpxP family protein refolding chaperone